MSWEGGFRQCEKPVPSISMAVEDGEELGTTLEGKDEGYSGGGGARAG